MFGKIKYYWNERPLAFVIWIGFLLRMISVIFSKGFGMHDDHFLVIEAPGAWAQGTEYDDWLPSSGATRPDGHSFFYSGFHFIFFSLMRLIGWDDPQFMMLLVRLFHAVLSLGTIYFGYRIADKFYGVGKARIVGLLLAAIWFMPFISVRNLVEVVCIPFLMGGLWYLIDADGKEERKEFYFYFLAGLLLGIGFCIRFQSVFFIAGAGLGLLLQGRIKPAFTVAAGTLSVFMITQSPLDLYIWGYPFAQFIEYVRYNLEHAHSYLTGAWYKYILVILGVLVPPLSILMFWGWLKDWKRSLPAFLAVFVFLAFHSYFPNKQERFILPIVPFFIVMGLPAVLIYLDERRESGFWRVTRKVSWVMFWILNAILILPVSTMYSKRARVESMTYLYPRRDSINCIISEDMNRHMAYMSPQFYLGKWVKNFRMGHEFGYDSLVYYLDGREMEHMPNYIIFIGDEGIDERTAKMKEYLPDIELEKTIQPGWIDKLLYTLNPKNKNDVMYIYRINDYPESYPG
jgi:hypothetical protein